MIGLVGKTLGKYRILARLGREGTATVYKAYQPGLDRYVAVKVLHSHLAEDEDFIRRFEREASAVARLRHPNIVRVHDFDHIGQLYYMVMEFIEGPSLKEELRVRNSSSQAFTLSEIARFFGALGGAIDYAHEQGMIHHDLKPANIMFTAQGQAVLTDFGIAKIVGHTTETLTGAVFGTPTYMSPEQGKGQRGDERSDIYSLGIILFEVVTGQVPFDDDTPYTIINRHISDPLPSPSSLNPDLPLEVERVILKATEKSPDARFQSGCYLAQALYQAVGLLDEQSLVSAPVVPLAEVAEPPSVDMDSEFPLYTPAGELEAPSPTKIEVQEPPTRLLQRQPYITAGVIVLLLLIGLVGAYGIFGDGVFPPFPPATATPTPQPPVATPTPPGALAVTNTATSSPTATATNTPTATPTPAPTSTATPTPSPSPTATETLTPSPTAVPPSPTPTRISPEDLYNRILFKTDRAGTVQIYSMNPDGSDQQLMPEPVIYNQLEALEALSPDGKQQVVVRTEGNAELWLITLDASQDEWRITYTAEYDYDPAWSPAGELIAFVSERTGNGDIYISTPLGFSAERITLNEDPYDRHPSWSPDGQYLVFWSNAQFGLRQLYIYDVQTGETHSVGGGPYNDWDPLWVK